MRAMIETMEATHTSGSLDSDKKRNKLGYHRTSVACVHCRRRKIRCLVAADDTQGRCENCIRLRKECQFFPVDQQPPIEKKARPSSRLETQSSDLATTPVASSPIMHAEAGVPVDYYQYPQVPLSSSAGQDMAAFSPNAYAGTPLSSFSANRPMGPGDYPGHPAMESGLSWDEFTTITEPHIMATMAGKGPMMALAPNVWNPGSIPNGLPPSSPMSGGSPMPGHAQPVNPAMYALQSDGTAWPVQSPPPPSRALSYPGQPEMSSSYPTSYPQQMPPDLKRRVTVPTQQSMHSPSDVLGSSAPGSEMHVPPGSVPYPVQAGIGYASWPMNAMPSGMNVVYPDAMQQQFHSPMGQPGHSGP
ncbi:hypothetical protein N7495_007453 [Penicillium taxi]|uniref:uncharacterized protein n=1 Tax=Penicillium taxi TaxID=168475 RepID=UPI002544E7B1|nr:uncharacterized protein N7495_007453 [Penicillium taxi]KAJ5887412.1 hypothetical protein N7495_007453 [Penicillium taxi]